MSEKGPIVTILEKNRGTPTKVGIGNETKRNVDSFETVDAEGNNTSYVEKPLRDKETALDTLEMYQKMKALGLPVVDFLKIVKKREGVNAEDSYYISMQDLTNSGKNLIVELWKPYKDPETKQLHFAVNLLAEANNAEEIKDQMIKALAVLHNNGIFEFHPINSFALIVDKSKIGKGEKFTLSFKIIDYSNFTYLGSRRAKTDDIVDIDKEECIERNIDDLKNSISYNPSDRDTIQNRYQNYKHQDIKTFS